MTSLRRAAVSLLIGLLAPIGLGVLLGMFGPPRFSDASAPTWPAPLPQGWPDYPMQVARPGAGIKAEGAAGTAYLAHGFGRSLRVTRVYEMKGGLRTWYTFAEFRTGFPFEGTVAVRLSSPTWQEDKSFGTAIRQGISLGPSHASDLFGRTLLLMIEPAPFLANAVAWGLAGWIGLWSMAAVRAKRRIRRGECAKCGYPRQPDAVCPECGTCG